MARSKDETGAVLARLLEGRLINVVFRSGFAGSMSAARQLVSNGGVTVNGRVVDVPATRVAPGDTVAVRARAGSAGRPVRAGAQTHPEWLDVDFEHLVARVVARPEAAAGQGGPEVHAADLP